MVNLIFILSACFALAAVILAVDIDLQAEAYKQKIDRWKDQIS